MVIKLACRPLPTFVDGARDGCSTLGTGRSYHRQLDRRFAIEQQADLRPVSDNQICGSVDPVVKRVPRVSEDIGASKS